MTQISSNTFDLSVFDLAESTFLMEALGQGVNPVICSHLLASVLTDQILKLYPGTGVTKVPYGDKVELSVDGPCFTLAKNNLNYVSTLRGITRYLRPGSKTFPAGFTQESFRELQEAHPEAEFVLVEDPDGKWQTSISWTPAKKSKIEKFLVWYRDHYSARPNGRITATEFQIPCGVHYDLSREYKDRTFILSYESPNYTLSWSLISPKEVPEETKPPVSVIAPDLTSFLETVNFSGERYGSVAISQPFTIGALDTLNNRWKNQIFTTKLQENQYWLSWTRKPVTTDTLGSFLDEMASLITHSESGEAKLSGAIDTTWQETLKISFPNSKFELMSFQHIILWKKK